MIEASNFYNYNIIHNSNKQNNFKTMKEILILSRLSVLYAYN